MKKPHNLFFRFRKRFILYISLVYGVCLFCSAVHEAAACGIPVTRYALLYWPADYYEAVVFHKGPLSDGEKALMGRLDGQSPEKGAPVANTWVEAVDVGKEMDKAVKELWQASGFSEADLPRIAVYYPRYEYPRYAQFPLMIWSGPLTEQSVEMTLFSPVRREVAQRILKGDLVVWVLLESGDKKMDDKAFSTIKKYTAILEKEWEFPDTAAEPLPGMSAPDESLPLKMKFSALRMSRTDPKEEVLRSMLLKTEKDLEKKAGEPIAFPMFGKGRMLESLMGKGINEDNIVGMCGFLVGPCSCQIKGLNPGVDLLIAADWEGAVNREVSVENALPPVTMFMDPGTEDAKHPSKEQEGGPRPAAKGDSMWSGYMLTAVIGMIALILVVLAVGTATVLRKSKEKQKS